MHASLIYSKDAEEDVTKIVHYISKKLVSPKAAIKTIKKIYKKCELISITPEAYPHHMRTDPNYKIRYQVANAGNYTIIYRFDKKANTVIILRIVYSRSSYENIVKMINFEEYIK